MGQQNSCRQQERGRPHSALCLRWRTSSIENEGAEAWTQGPCARAGDLTLRGAGLPSTPKFWGPTSSRARDGGGPTPTIELAAIMSGYPNVHVDADAEI